MPAVAEIVKKYVEPMIRKFGKRIKAVWVYGSSARGEAKKTSDIDVLVLVDDVSSPLSVAEMNMISAEMDKAAELARKDGWILHFQSPKPLTQWWDLLRSGEPWVLTGMRDSLIIHDPSGFVKPIKRLLEAGRIGPTKERAAELLRRVEERRKRIERMLVEDIMSEILLAMTESAQAVIIYTGKPPVPANRIYSELKKLAKKGIIGESTARIYREFYRIAKKMDRSPPAIGIKELEEYMEEAKMFLEEMERAFEALEKEKHEKIISESLSEAISSVKKILKKYGLEGKSDEEMIKGLKKLVEEGKVSKYYLELLEFVVSTAKKFRSGKPLSEREIYNSRLYALTMRDYAEVL